MAFKKNAKYHSIIKVCWVLYQKIITYALQYAILHDNGSALNKNVLLIANNYNNRNAPLEKCVAGYNFALKEA